MPLKITTHISIVGVICLFIIAGDSSAASFNCSKATTAVEVMICKNENLSKLDELMVKIYAHVLNLSPIRTTIRKSQSHWLRVKRSMCTNPTCLKTAYENRILELRAIEKAASGDTNGFSGGGQYKISDSWPTGIHDHNVPMYEEYYDLCYSFQAALSANGQLKSPLTCERPLEGSLDFSRPKWSSLDNAQILPLAQRLEILMEKSFGRDATTWVMSDDTTNRFRKRIDEGDINISVATIPVGRNGAEMALLRYQRRRCEPKNWKFNFGRVEFFRVEGSEFSSLHWIKGSGPDDVFLFKGRGYFDSHSYRDFDDSFQSKLPGSQPLIFIHQMYDDNYHINVCRFAYWEAGITEQSIGRDKTRRSP